MYNTNTGASVGVGVLGLIACYETQMRKIDQLVSFLRILNTDRKTLCSKLESTVEVGINRIKYV